MIAHNTGTDHRNWDQYLPEISFAINTAVSESSKYSPAEVVFGHNPITPNTLHLPTLNPPRNNNMYKELWKNVKENRRKASHTQQHYYNLRRRIWTPATGSEVWVRERQLSSAAENFNQKLAPKYSGPYVVSSVIHPNIVEVRDEKGKTKRVSLQDLKPYLSSKLNDNECIITIFSRIK
ncbi:uncharacterized protein LOC133321108 [Musca vetustissima]|uniref:uncharacterized protein LOC133321108 n=1 Tax=Musca vetustissima TaxID=27455 RepID=UPI002AB6A5FE|nr:uncharacterized protein LOC133321108 [Musca vetustissima]